MAKQNPLGGPTMQGGAKQIPGSKLVPSNLGYGELWGSFVNTLSWIFKNKME